MDDNGMTTFEVARFGLKAAAMSTVAFGLLALLITAVLTAAGF